MALPFQTLDVFTSTPFHGNPLAVVTVPPGTSVPQARKQAIAREFNYSETVFVHGVEQAGSGPDASVNNSRRIDIFTPRDEIPFAGHPTIGTAVSLWGLGVRVLVVKAGRIDIESVGDGALRAAVPHNVRLHQARLPGPSPSLSSSTTGFDVASAERGAPLFSIVKGMTFALIELPSLEALAAVQVGPPELPADLLDDGWRDGWVTRRYYYVRTGNSSDAANGSRPVVRLRTRMVKLATEDAGTGSAACALGAYLALHVLREPSVRFELTQGVEMGRESNILVDVEVEADADGTRELKSVHLGGKAVAVSQGSISV